MEPRKCYGRGKPETLFIVQITILCIVIITSLINVILRNDPCSVWSNLLASSLGYLLPNPSMGEKKEEEEEDEAQTVVIGTPHRVLRKCQDRTKTRLDAAWLSGDDLEDHTHSSSHRDRTETKLDADWLSRDDSVDHSTT